MAIAIAAAATIISVDAAAASRVLPNRTIRLGSTYFISGQTRSLRGSVGHVQGPLTLSGSWDGGPWHVITRTRTRGSTGRYRIVVRPRRRGVLRLRLRTPDTVYSVTLKVI